MTNQNKICCFFGHRGIEESENLKNKIFETVENLILNHSVDTFLFGSKSKFDTLCRKVVSELKEKYPNIKRSYVRAEYPYISEDYEKYLLKNFEETYFPENALNTGKAVYVNRSQSI